jgi:hypothetical protein
MSGIHVQVTTLGGAVNVRIHLNTMLQRAQPRVSIISTVGAKIHGFCIDSLTSQPNKHTLSAHATPISPHTRTINWKQLGRAKYDS